MENLQNNIAFTTNITIESKEICVKKLLEYPVAAIVSHDMINSIIENAYEKKHTQTDLLLTVRIHFLFVLDFQQSTNGN